MAPEIHEQGSIAVCESIEMQVLTTMRYHGFKNHTKEALTEASFEGELLIYMFLYERGALSWTPNGGNSKTVGATAQPRRA